MPAERCLLVDKTKTGPAGPRFHSPLRVALSLQLSLEQLDVLCNRKIRDLRFGQLDAA